MDRIRDEINGRGMGPRDQTFRPCLCPYTSVSVYVLCVEKIPSSSHWTMKALYHSCAKYYYSPKKSRSEWYVRLSFRDFFCIEEIPLNSNYIADSLSGSGSVQATVNSVDVGKDAPFWNAVKQNLQNLVAVVSGHDHGNEWCAREPTKDIIFCFNKHSG